MAVTGGKFKENTLPALMTPLFWEKKNWLENQHIYVILFGLIVIRILLSSTSSVSTRTHSAKERTRHFNKIVTLHCIQIHSNKSVSCRCGATSIWAHRWVIIPCHSPFYANYWLTFCANISWKSRNSGYLMMFSLELINCIFSAWDLAECVQCTINQREWEKMVVHCHKWD